MTVHEFALANPEAAATALSVLAAVCAGFLGYRESRARHRREHTLSVLAPLLTNDRFFRTHHTIINHRINDTRPDYNALSDAEREDILQLLGYYEFLAASYLRRDLHRGTVLRQRRSTFRGAWDTLTPFIGVRRKLLNNNKVYCDFETFVTRHCS